MNRFGGYGLVVIAVVAGLIAVAPVANVLGTEEDWVISSFEARYVLDESGTVAATEDIIVDFGSLERHGIFRDIPVEYEYDEKSNRLIGITGVSVTDGMTPVPFEASDSGPNIRIKVGDPDELVSGRRRYVIGYTINDGLNPFPDHDELYWNVTGNEWPVPIATASAVVSTLAPGIERIACYQGPTGSTDPCVSSGDQNSASFQTSEGLGPGSGLTLVVGLRKGLIAVDPPRLVPADDEPLIDTSFGNLFEVHAVTIGAMLLTAAAVLTALGRQWWVAGRDRWYGDKYYLSEKPQAALKPLFARETVVVEYQPPDVGRGRRLRPAEIGLLLDERADTLDVSATIVDLAVRRHIVIKELPKGGIFGVFKSQDYELQQQEGAETDAPADGLLPYESTLKSALFDGNPSVKLSELKNKFHDDLAQVKGELYEESVKSLKLFPRDPEKVRMLYRVAGIVIAGIGGLIAFLLGAALGGGLVGVPIAAGGLTLFALSHLMPRRTAEGRQLYRRCLGFRLYMTEAEEERQRFAEKANLFEEYLPYAIVYGCVKKWATAFEGLGLEGRETYWYVGSHGFAPAQFADSLGDFSASVSGVMASTPGGSGSSGFGGGGSSGGGGGGGGGGSW